MSPLHYQPLPLPPSLQYCQEASVPRETNSCQGRGVHILPHGRVSGRPPLSGHSDLLSFRSYLVQGL